MKILNKIIEAVLGWYLQLRLRGLEFDVEVTHAESHFIVAVSASPKNCRRLDLVPGLADSACDNSVAIAKEHGLPPGETMTRTFKLKGMDRVL